MRGPLKVCATLGWCQQGQVDTSYIDLIAFGGAQQENVVQCPFE